MDRSEFSKSTLVTILSWSGALLILSIIRPILSFYFCLKASQRLHDKMLQSVLRARIQFFDTNPLGRILNRFSSDVGVCDEIFPLTLYDFLVGLFMVVGGIVTASVVLPFILLVLPPLILCFVRLRRTFLATSRELKRLEGIARSPIYAMISESLTGIATIRPNRKLDYFKSKFERIHNAHTKAYMSFVVASRWFAFKLDLLSFILTAAATLLAVLFDDQQWFQVDPAILGLALTLLIQISTTNFPWIVRQSAEVTNQMVSVERILEFGDLPPEGATKTNFDDCGTNNFNWPIEASISFQNVNVKYRPNLPLALNGVSFEIPSGHRVGVVGRTGSGKSTLVQTLFRILELDDGTIEVGGVDISLLGLHKLRTSMTVIPQSPVLFKGCTVRENLDPFGKYSDKDIIMALEEVEMFDVINALQNGIHTDVDEGGSNFSAGQRQLLCLARAILVKTKILILDEPTANCDMKTSHLVQRTLKEKFRFATIISVAHRLESIIEYELVLVLGNGKVLEFGPPKELLLKHDGHFTSMVESTGEKMASLLKRKIFDLHEDKV